MNTLTLISTQKKLRYALFSGNRTKKASLSGEAADCRGEEEAKAALETALADCDSKGKKPSLICLRVPYGNTLFPEAVIADDAVLTRLETLIPQAPLHLPVTLAVARACKRLCQKIPLVLAFETSFFSALPERERSYALDPALAEQLGLLRSGYHGLYHQAALEHILLLSAKRMKPAGKILSICLDKRPEITAVAKLRPLYVTSGATPLEGLPGECSSGEIDPFLVTMLAKKLSWGPEQINMMLTQESGLRGLLDESITLEALLASKDRKHRLAKKLFKYRVLLACGAGIAAMGGLDAIVFSGLYAKAGRFIAAFLKRKLKLSEPVAFWSSSGKSMPEILALLANKTAKEKGLLRELR